MSSSSDVTAKCLYCGFPLSPTHVDPCPNCGKIGKSVVARIVESLNVKDAVSASGLIAFSAHNIPTPDWWSQAANAITLNITHQFENKLPEILERHDKDVELKEKRLTRRARRVIKGLIWVVIGIFLGRLITALFGL